MDPIVRRMFDRARPVMDFVDEEIPFPSKLTLGGVVTWIPEPSLEKMLRKEASKATSHGGQERVVPREVPGESGEKGDLEKGRPRGSFRAALEIVKDKVLMATAMMDALKKDFWSGSNREAQASKRKLVVELAQAVGGEWWTPPLTEAVVLGVAAALKAADLKTAAAMDKSLWLCNEHLGSLGIWFPALAYAWAIFMLRCAEVAAAFADKVKKVIKDPHLED